MAFSPLTVKSTSFQNSSIHSTSAVSSTARAMLKTWAVLLPSWTSTSLPGSTHSPPNLMTPTAPTSARWRSKACS